MKRTFQILLLLLWIAVLPCGPHDSGPAMTAGVHHGCAASAHAHQEGKKPVHDANTAGFEQTSQAPGIDFHQCGACAACCIGAAGPPPAVLAAMPLRPAFSAPYPSLAPAGVIPSGLERPPRHIFA